MLPRCLLLIMALALVLRLSVVAGTWDAQPWGDPADYHIHGASLALVGHYPATTFAEPGGASALRPPVFPYLLGATYELTGVRVNAGRLIGVLLGTLSVGLVFLFARRLWGQRHALWAAGLTAVFPPLVWLSAALLSEVVFVPLLLGLVLVLLHLRDRPATLPAALAGLLLGLAVLTRTHGLLLLAPACIALLAIRPPGRGRAAAVMLAVFAMTLIPWTVRNLDALDALRPFGTQGGYAMAGQLNSQAARNDALRAVWRNPTEVPEFFDLFHRPGLSEADVDAQLRKRTLRFAGDRPGHVLAAVRLNSQRMFEAGPGHTFVSQVAHREMGIPTPWRGSAQLSVYAFALAALIGGVLLVRRRQLGPIWLWLIPVVLFASATPLAGSPRYRAPIDPFLLMLAAGAVVQLTARIGLRR